ncbi:putative glucosylceramidase 4 [Macrosteles quadrilineatus]|uniref:putative glucosylceramidase 4 n=1 Tax=Macrosteles quadrilineatus TaxID=74068 RepID=UPI0023E1933E|nr:putative glucosylceramidase 4 [Macrosteles quadrilineatus]
MYEGTMIIPHKILLISFVSFTVKLSLAEMIPCNVRKASSGYVCVCNATYCDTVEKPAVIARGLYLHYSTSKETPGFSVSSGNFTNSTIQLRENSEDVIIQVNSTIQYQTFEGIGAALTASSATAISSLPHAAKQKLIESYFGQTGVEYSFVRVPAEPTDFTPAYATYDDIPGDTELKYFNLTKDDLDFKIPLLHLALNVSRRNIKLIGVAWTAPHWMKTNNDMSAGYIRKDHLSTYAKYLLKFLQAYKSFGLDFWGITFGNQVAVFWSLNLPIPSIIMPPQQARIFIKYLRPLLQDSGFENVKILGLDDQRPFTLWYFDRLFSEQEAEQFVDGAAIHWYYDDDVNIYILDEFHQKYPEKVILYTECSIIDFLGFNVPDIGSGDWESAVIYLNNIFQNLAHWVGGYLDWNIALDENGGPAGFLNSTMDTQIIINTTSGEFYKQPSHYVLGHFSKFITPGAKLIKIEIYDDISITTDKSKNNAEPEPTKKPFILSNRVLAVAALNPDGSHAVIAYNPHPHPVNLIVFDSDAGSFNQTVQAYSLNTFVFY